MAEEAVESAGLLRWSGLALVGGGYRLERADPVNIDTRSIRAGLGVTPCQGTVRRLVDPSTPVGPGPLVSGDLRPSCGPAVRQVASDLVRATPLARGHIADG